MVVLINVHSRTNVQTLRQFIPKKTVYTLHYGKYFRINLMRNPLFFLYNYKYRHNSSRIIRIYYIIQINGTFYVILRLKLDWPSILPRFQYVHIKERSLKSKQVHFIVRKTRHMTNKLLKGIDQKTPRNSRISNASEHDFAFSFKMQV